MKGSEKFCWDSASYTFILLSIFVISGTEMFRIDDGGISDVVIGKFYQLQGMNTLCFESEFVIFYGTLMKLVLRFQGA